MHWYCRTCGLNAKMEFWPTEIGERYLCHSCGRSGRMTHSDHPVQITFETHDKYWYELQTDECFIPPEQLYVA